MADRRVTVEWYLEASDFIAKTEQLKSGVAGVKGEMQQLDKTAGAGAGDYGPVSYTHLRAHET